MKKNVTFAASALAALTIGLATPAVASQSGSSSGPDVVTVDSGYPTSGQTPYGTYQNAHKGR